MRRREMRRVGGDDDEVDTKGIPRRLDQSEKEMKRVRQELGKGGKDDSLTRSENRIVMRKRECNSICSEDFERETRLGNEIDGFFG
jgi:hypothetical protein